MLNYSSKHVPSQVYRFSRKSVRCHIIKSLLRTASAKVFEWQSTIRHSWIGQHGGLTSTCKFREFNGCLSNDDHPDRSLDCCPKTTLVSANTRWSMILMSHWAKCYACCMRLIRGKLFHCQDWLAGFPSLLRSSSMLTNVCGDTVK